MRVLIGIMLLAYATASATAPRWHWEGRFSEQEKAGLSDWIEQVLHGMTTLLGEPSDTFHVHFVHRSSDEPVPWGETNKGRGRRAYLHVDTRYPWTAFVQDWTAPHELSHLLFPYLGEDSRWFAEGIASYLQYQIMYASGVLSWEQVIARYDDRFRSARAGSRFGDMSIVEHSRRASSSGYVRLYWGGAAYFLQADRQLYLAHGTRLTDVIRKYAVCCYQPWGVDADGMINQFDRLSGGTVFAKTYARTVARPGFPDTAEALEWLQQHPPLQLQRSGSS
ncbi:MAG: hypothetical protein ACRETN_09355 [Nevskiales bacterium]